MNTIFMVSYDNENHRKFASLGLEDRKYYFPTETRDIYEGPFNSYQDACKGYERYLKQYVSGCRTGACQ